MKHRIIESAILAFGLLLLGLFIQNGIKSFAQRDRAVSVKGLAEKESRLTALSGRCLSKKWAMTCSCSITLWKTRIKPLSLF